MHIYALLQLRDDHAGDGGQHRGTRYVSLHLHTQVTEE